MAQPEPRRVRVADEAGDFDVTVLEPQDPVCTVLFAVGAGGNPSRHMGLLGALAGRGCTVVAPHFEPLATPTPTKAELGLRIRRLDVLAARHAPPGTPCIGVGHSIGTVTLLVLAGAEARTRAGEPVASRSAWRFARVALLTPPTDFFRWPGALRDVRTPIRAWAGGKDTITPASQAQFLRDALSAQTAIEVILDPDAGHFSYMDDLPPHLSDPHPDRAAFLAALHEDVAGFVLD